jgi:intracellular septation protein
MGGALLVGQVFFRRNWLQSLMKSQMALPDHAWRVMLWSWCGFFAVMGVLNIWVAYHFDTDTWVNFKLFGGIGLMLVFVLAQAMYLGRFIDKGENPDVPPESKP